MLILFCHVNTGKVKAVRRLGNGKMVSKAGRENGGVVASLQAAGFGVTIAQPFELGLGMAACWAWGGGEVISNQ